MRIPRIFLPKLLHCNESVALDEPATSHVVRVLRLKEGAKVILFNGQGGEYHGELQTIKKNIVTAVVYEHVAREAESALRITLAQGVSRGERMDYTIQKAVELGVTHIVPLDTQRSVVNLKGERSARRIEHWQQVVVSACEQCGRNRVPQVEDIRDIKTWLPKSDGHTKFVLHHAATQSLSEFSQCPDSICLLIGPEGGLEEDELRLAQTAGFVPLRLGPRILRTETAALVALSALQMKWGDLD